METKYIDILHQRSQQEQKENPKLKPQNKQYQLFVTAIPYKIFMFIKLWLRFWIPDLYSISTNS